jgi:dipeptide transport system substrate-binding protein
MKYLYFIFLLLPILARAEKELIYCAEAEPSIFNPQLAADGATFSATRPIYNGLLSFEKGGVKVVARLAKAWTVSPDGKVITFQLRDDVEFQSNGSFKPKRKFNADDVVFTFERMLSAEHPYHLVGGGTYKYFLSLEMAKIIRKVEKVDDYTVRFILTRPEAPLIANMAMDFASILSKEYGDYLLAQKKPELIDSEPIGTGPFKLVKYEKGKEITYAAHRAHFDDSPKLDKLKFIIIASPEERVKKLKSGECHITSSVPLQSIDALRRVPGVRIMGQPGLNIFYVAMNNTKAPFDNKLVRQAMSYAINRDKIIKDVFNLYANLAKNPMPPNMWGYNRGASDYEYNPQKAKELLVRAGYPDGFTTNLWYMSVSRPYNPNGYRVAQLISDDLKKIGVKVTLQTKDWTSYLKSAASGELEMLQAGWTSDNGDPDNFLNLLLSCSSIEGGNNYARWCNQEYSHLVSRARVTTNIRKRTEFYEKAQNIFKNEMPWVPIAHVSVYKAMSKRVLNYQMNPFGHDEFGHVDLQMETAE